MEKAYGLVFLSRCRKQQRLERKVKSIAGPHQLIAAKKFNLLDQINKQQQQQQKREKNKVPTTTWSYNSNSFILFFDSKLFVENPIIEDYLYFAQYVEEGITVKSLRQHSPLISRDAFHAVVFHAAFHADVFGWTSNKPPSKWPFNNFVLIWMVCFFHGPTSFLLEIGTVAN